MFHCEFYSFHPVIARQQRHVDAHKCNRTARPTAQQLRNVDLHECKQAATWLICIWHEEINLSALIIIRTITIILVVHCVA